MSSNNEKLIALISRVLDIDKNSKKNVISLGFGSMYNSSPDKKENARMEWNLNNDILIFKSIKDIKKDKEILLEYDLGFKSDKKI